MCTLSTAEYVACAIALCTHVQPLILQPLQVLRILISAVYLDTASRKYDIEVLQKGNDHLKFRELLNLGLDNLLLDLL